MEEKQSKPEVKTVVKRRKRTTKDSPHYVDGKKLFEELSKHRAKYLETGERPQLNDYLGDAITKIAQRTVTNRRFNGYSYKDEMIYDAIELCIKYVHNFDPNKTQNAFAYVTQICWNGFRKRANIENRNLYIKYKAMLESEMNMELHSESDVDVSNAMIELGFSKESRIKMYEFIKDYEEKHFKNKKKNKEIAAKVAEDSIKSEYFSDDKDE